MNKKTDSTAPQDRICPRTATLKPHQRPVLGLRLSDDLSPAERRWGALPSCQPVTLGFATLVRRLLGMCR